MPMLAYGKESAMEAAKLACQANVLDHKSLLATEFGNVLCTFDPAKQVWEREWVLERDLEQVGAAPHTSYNKGQALVDELCRKAVSDGRETSVYMCNGLMVSVTVAGGVGHPVVYKISAMPEPIGRRLLARGSAMGQNWMAGYEDPKTPSAPA